MDRQALANRYRLLTAACRQCRVTLRLGHCELCPMTEQRRQARQGSKWETPTGRDAAGDDLEAPRPSAISEP